MLLELHGVKKRFGAIEALQSVSLSVDAGEIVGLVGDNGAGKSTLMKVVTGVYTPDEGRVVFDGRDVTREPPRTRRLLGIEMIYQDLALARQQNVASNIFLGREPVKRFLGIPYRIDREAMEIRARDILQRLGVEIPSVRMPVGKLSGGQQQTVAIARALTFEPRLVIMDEPTAALAVREVEHVLDVTRALKGQGIGVIFISHRLNDVLAVCDRIVVLRRGRVVGLLRTEETDQHEVIAYIVGAKGETSAA